MCAAAYPANRTTGAGNILQIVAGPSSLHRAIGQAFAVRAARATPCSQTARLGSGPVRSELQLEVAQQDATDHDHVAVAQIGLLDTPTVDEGAV